MRIGGQVGRVQLFGGVSRLEFLVGVAADPPVFQAEPLWLVQHELVSLVGPDAPIVLLGGLIVVVVLLLGGPAGAVGIPADGTVDVLAAGTPVAGGGELQRPQASFQENDFLNGSLAEGPLADDHGPVVVLETGGHDLAGAGTSLVDQHGDGEAAVGAGPGCLVLSLDLLAAVARGDDHAGIDQQVAGPHGRAEQPAGIVPQVQDQPPHPRFGQRVQGALQLVDGLLAEILNAQVADPVVAFEEVVPVAFGVAAVAQHAVDRNDRADDGHVDRLLLAGVLDGQHDRLFRLAPHPVGGFLDRQPVCADAVDGQDLVAGKDSRFLGGRVVQRRDHRELLGVPVQHDPNPHASEFLVQALLELGQLLGRDIHGMNVQPPRHPVQGPFEKVPLVHFHQGPLLDFAHGEHEDPAVVVHLQVAGQRQGGNEQQQSDVAAGHRACSGFGTRRW